jgi:deoxyribodipyrimidine photolyase
MIAAMFLTKDLMMDWRLGEQVGLPSSAWGCIPLTQSTPSVQYFMQIFIDGDLAANNGGWQWSASTGTDPQPYFRIFNPYLQAEKARFALHLPNPQLQSTVAHSFLPFRLTLPGSTSAISYRS